MSELDKYDRDAWLETMVRRGHNPKVEANGRLALVDHRGETGGCPTGPICEDCGWTVCMLCDTPTRRRVPWKCREA